MSEGGFEFLTGAVTVNVVAPQELQQDGGLPEFYRNPNHELWGGKLCRVLYHESVHFWQILASGYIANLVAQTWHRLTTYELEGHVLPISQDEQVFKQRLDGAPFSAGELMECWTRYWDVHTRSPAQIIREEKLRNEVTAEMERQGANTDATEYSWVAFDTVMQEGPDCHVYAAPYRWMLSRVREHWRDKGMPYGMHVELLEALSSCFVNLLFPILAHAAFGSPDPVTVICKALDRALHSDEFQLGFLGHRSGNINFDWLNNWSFVLGEAISPIIQENRLPTYTSGFDVIHRGILHTHPVFSEYLEKSQSILGHLKMEKQARASTGSPSEEQWAEVDMPSRDPWIVFGLPGQPYYRAMLGRGVPPPAIRFENFIIYAHRPMRLCLQHPESDDTYEQVMIDLQSRVRRFRAAEKAVSLGLPPNVFESSS